MFNRTPLLLLGILAAHWVLHSAHEVRAQDNRIAVSTRPESAPSDYFVHENNLPGRTVLSALDFENGLMTIEEIVQLANGIPARTPHHDPHEFGIPIPIAAATTSESEFTPLAPLTDDRPIHDPLFQTVGYQDPEVDDDNDDEKSKVPLSPTIKQDTTLVDLEQKIKVQKDLIEGNDSLEATQKTDQLEIINKAMVALEAAKSSDAFIEEQRQLQAEYEQTLQRLKSESDSLVDPRIPDADTPSRLLQTELETKQKSLQTFKADLASFKNRIVEREKRIAEIPGLRSTELERQKKLKQSLKELKDTSNNITGQLQALVLQARQLASAKTLGSLEIEFERRSETGNLLTTKRNLTTREIARLNSETKTWRAAYTDQRKNELAQQEKEAEVALEEAISAAPALKALAKRNQELIGIRGEITGKIQATREENDSIKKKTEDFEKRTKSLKQKIETTRMTPSIGIHLIEQRNDLTQPTQSLVRIDEIASEIQRIKLASIELKEKRSALDSPREFVNRLIDDNRFPGMTTRDVETMANNLVDTQLKYDNELEKDYEKYRELLVSAETSHRIFIEQFRAFRAYVAQTALWIQSTNLIAVSDFEQSPDCARSYFQIDAWRDLGESLTNRFFEKPHESAIAAVLLVGLFLVKRRLKVMYG